MSNEIHWTRDKIRELLVKSSTMVERSLLILYARQTKDERVAENTTHHNCMGFSACDAKILSSFARQIKTNKYGYPEGRRLSLKQLYIARKCLKKYANQLAMFANTQNEIKVQEALGTADKMKGEIFQKGGTFCR